MEIPSINPIQISPIGQSAISKNKPVSQTDGLVQSFDQVLTSLTQSQENADSLVSSLASGGNVDLHNVMIASEENDVNFRVAIAIRDRLVDAYREVMRMSI